MSDLTVNGINVGSDATVTLQDSQGRQYTAGQLGILQDIDLEIMEDMIKAKSIVAGGLTFIECVPGSVSVKLGMVRNTGNVTGLIIDYRNNWFKGIRLSYSVQISVRSPAGNGVDTYVINNCKPGKNSLSAKPDAAMQTGITFEGQDIQTSAVAGLAALFPATTGQ